MTVFVAVTAGLVIANMVLLAIVYLKLSKILHFARRDIANGVDITIAQVEGLLAAYAEIKPASSLPRTRGWAASPDFLQALGNSVRERRPQTVLECSSGVSTVLLAAAMRNQGAGKVFSLEHDPLYAGKTRALLSHFGLEAWAEVVDAPLVQLDLEGWSGRWYDTARLDSSIKADILVVDGPPETTSPLARYPALPALEDRLSAGAWVFMDDAHRPAEVLIVERWTTKYRHVKSLFAPKCEKGCVLLEVGVKVEH